VKPPECQEENDEFPSSPEEGRAPEGAPREDRAATVARLFREHNRTLIGFLIARLRNEQEAHEIAQEAYVKVLQLEQKPGASNFMRSYLFRVAQNLAVDRIRQRQIRTRLDSLQSLDRVFEDGQTERAAMAEQELALLKRIVAELPDTCRIAFCFHKLEERPLEEVASLMNLKERMVRRHVSRALVYIQLRREGLSPQESWDGVMAS
jgi:RNA polymerase sigma-70 factor (ECF subfamily)